MVTDVKPQILNCNIQFYFKSIEQTITFKLKPLVQKPGNYRYLVFAEYRSNGF